MRSIAKNWFIATVKYDSVNDSGVQIKMTENYCVDAVNLSELESKVVKRLQRFVSGEINVVKAGLAPFHEVLLSDNDNEDRFYDVKVKVVTLDEKSGKEKKSTIPYLVQGKSTSNAEGNVREAFKGTTFDYEITKVAESSVLEVIE